MELQRSSASREGYKGKDRSWAEERIRLLEEENAKLRKELEYARKNTMTEGSNNDEVNISWDQERREEDDSDSVKKPTSSLSFEGKLTRSQIERYSRQLLLHRGFGVEGQLELLKSSVLVIGAGGIGSTVILYLAACGVGNITISDFDQVDVSNLHRQVIHKTKDVSLNKAESARRAVHDLNPSISCTVVTQPLTSANAIALVSSHDCIVDASDNPQTRYLINDACILGGKTLVSGSAMGVEGQLTVYNYQGGQCYRCLYPKPNVTEGSKTCAENGVLGPVPGLIGVLQAIETIKVITGVGAVLSDKLLMYDALQCSFLRIKKPPKNPNCPVCGSDATIKSMADSLAASESARGPTCSVNLSSRSMTETYEISCIDYDRIRNNRDAHVLLDVRVPEQFELCALPGAINIPLNKLPQKLNEVAKLSEGTKPIYCICRRGIASVAATEIIRDALHEHPSIHSVKNIKGGLNAWRTQVDESFPRY